MKTRLDELVVERGLAGSRDAAKRLILAGKVLINGQRADKPGRTYDAEVDIAVEGPKSPFVSRGGEKLAGALDAWALKIPRGCRALDIGASTGGFTDCLLSRGAARVVAVDTGRGQLHERLRADPRVEVREKTNARYLTLEDLGGEPFDFIVMDVSFISLRLILPACRDLLGAGGDLVALVKPQFEAGRKQVGSGGVVRDPAVHRDVLEAIVAFAQDRGWIIYGLTLSPLLGADGNVEFFIHLRRDETAAAAAKIDVEAVLAAAYNLQTGR